MFCDAHVHFLEKETKSLFWEICETPQEILIDNIAINTASQEEWTEVVSIKKYPFLKRCLGLHPWYIHQATADWQADFLTKLSQIDGVGEIGLDFLHNRENQKEQINVFLFQAQHAAQKKIPFMIHQCRAWNEMQILLKKDIPYRTKWLYHGFSGSKEMVKEILDLEGMISIGPNIFHSTKLQEVIKYIPLSSLLLESDFSSSWKGNMIDKKQYQDFIYKIYLFVAELYRCDLKNLENKLQENYKKLFNSTFIS